MPWTLRISSRAEKDLAGLPLAERRAVRAAIERAVANPRGADLKKLSGHDNRWRLRVGRWRVLLAFDNRLGVMTVTRVLDRKDAY
jgi:mRNA interferase RelE/StbE